MAKMNDLTKSILHLLFDAVDNTVSGFAFSLISPRPFYRQIFIETFYPTYPRPQILRTIFNLKQRGYLQTIENNSIQLTPKGLDRVKKFKLEELRIKPTEKWDRKWRIVIWDIPERKKIRRHFIRSILKSSNFVRIQKSIWVTPWPCHEEIQFLRRELKLKNWLLYIESDYIEGSEVLSQYFKLDS